MTVLIKSHMLLVRVGGCSFLELLLYGVVSKCKIKQLLDELPAVSGQI